MSSEEPEMPLVSAQPKALLRPPGVLLMDATPCAPKDRDSSISTTLPLTHVLSLVVILNSLRPFSA